MTHQLPPRKNDTVDKVEKSRESYTVDKRHKNKKS